MKRCLILWTGNQMAGSEASQNIKNETQRAVLVPLSAEKELGIFVSSLTAAECQHGEIGRLRGWRVGHRIPSSSKWTES